MFFWTFWYIICIFRFKLNSYEFAKIQTFSRISNSTQHLCYWGWTYPELLTSGDLDRVNFHASRRPSQSRWRGKPWHHHCKSSQVAQESEDLGRIRRDGLVHQVWKNKASLRVSAPLWFGHRNIAGGEFTRQQEMVYSDSELRTMLSTNKSVHRCACSPGFFLNYRWRRLPTESSSVSPILVGCCGRERRIPDDWGWIGPIPLAGMHTLSRRISGATRWDFGQPLATARKVGWS
jgi:hypothetical protein